MKRFFRLCIAIVDARNPILLGVKFYTEVSIFVKPTNLQAIAEVSANATYLIAKMERVLLGLYWRCEKANCQENTNGGCL